MSPWLIIAVIPSVILLRLLSEIPAYLRWRRADPKHRIFRRWDDA